MADFSEQARAWDQSYVQTYLGWHAHEQKLTGTYPVVDIYVGPKFEPIEFSSRASVSTALQEHLQNLPPDHPYAELNKQRIDASLFILAILEHQANPELSELIGQTLHVPVERVPAIKTRRMRQRIGGLLTSHNAILRFDQKSRGAYEGEFALTNDNDIREEFYVALTWAQKVTAPVIAMPNEVNVNLQLVSEDDSWIARVMTNEERDLVTILNTHPRFTHTAGRLAGLALHEIIGHWAQAKNWEAAIKADEMLPSAGLLTLHGPEVVQSEVIANTLVQAFLKDSPGESKGYTLAAMLDAYEMMIKYNMHLLANTTSGPAAAARKAARLLPFEDLKYLKDSATRRRDSLSFRCYGGSDWPALKLVLANSMHDKRMKLDRKREVLNNLVAGPLAYDGVAKSFIHQPH